MALILIVDDSPTELHVMQKGLEKRGFRTAAAADGAEGVRLAREMAPDLIFMDIVMPGMSGWALAETLSSLRPEMRVIYMSGYPDGVVARHCVTGAGVTILNKPFTREELTRRVEGVAVSVAEQ